MFFIRPIIRCMKCATGQELGERKRGPISTAVVTVGHHVVEGSNKATKAIHARTCGAGAPETVSAKAVDAPAAA